jgi:hypothetical protein
MNTWADKLRDKLLDNSALRDGLTDDEAQPLLDWGLALAEKVTMGMETRPEPQAEARYEALSSALPKLITRINWVTIHAAQKGADWTAQTMQQMNELNRILHGEAAPQLPQQALEAISNSPNHANTLQFLMHQLSPTEESFNGETPFFE